jgi:hypothetical protein
VVEALGYKLEYRGVRVPMRLSIFFNVFNPSCSTVALGFTQSLTEMSTRRSFWGKARRARKADNLTAIPEPSV